VEKVLGVQPLGALLTRRVHMGVGIEYGAVVNVGKKVFEAHVVR
jgi:hypothetical protein